MNENAATAYLCWLNYHAALWLTWDEKARAVGRGQRRAKGVQRTEASIISHTLTPPNSRQPSQ